LNASFRARRESAAAAYAHDFFESGVHVLDSWRADGGWLLSYTLRARMRRPR
jgi:hypothetical protein